MPLLADRNGIVGIDRDRRVPAAVNAVEFEQMRGRRDAAFQFVDMDDVQPVLGARIACRAMYAAERRAQREPADAAHAIDANFHRELP